MKIHIAVAAMTLGAGIAAADLAPIGEPYGADSWWQHWFDSGYKDYSFDLIGIRIVSPGDAFVETDPIRDLPEGWSLSYQNESGTEAAVSGPAADKGLPSSLVTIFKDSVAPIDLDVFMFAPGEVNPFRTYQVSYNGMRWDASSDTATIAVREDFVATTIPVPAPGAVLVGAIGLVVIYRLRRRIR